MKRGKAQAGKASAYQLPYFVPKATYLESKFYLLSREQRSHSPTIALLSNC